MDKTETGPTTGDPLAPCEVLPVRCLVFSASISANENGSHSGSDPAYFIEAFIVVIVPHDEIPSVICGQQGCRKKK